MGLARTLCRAVLRTAQLPTRTAMAPPRRMMPAPPGRTPTWQPCWRRWTLRARGERVTSTLLVCHTVCHDRSSAMSARRCGCIAKFDVSAQPYSLRVSLIAKILWTMQSQSQEEKTQKEGKSKGRGGYWQRQRRVRGRYRGRVR